MTQDIVYFFSFGLREHLPFDNNSGNIGITLFLKYIEVPLFKASISKAEFFFTYSDTSAIETNSLKPEGVSSA